MIIHKKICNNCGKEKDLMDIDFGYEVEQWQKIIERVEHGTEKKHFCSIKCIVSYYMKKEKV